MEDLKVLIIEDDISFALGVEMQLEEFRLQHVKKVHSEEEALAAIDDFRPDLALVDIRLNSHPEELKVSKSLYAHKIPFIIMTQYKESDLYHEIASLNPLAYFSKPLDYVALKYTIDSYFQSDNSETREHEEFRKEDDQFQNRKGDFLFIKKGNKYLKVRFDDMLYVQAEGNYVTIHTHSSKFVVRGSLKRSLDVLDPSQFLQIHRNFAVNKHYVDMYDSESRKLTVRDHVLPVGRSYRSTVRKLILAKL